MPPTTIFPGSFIDLTHTLHSDVPSWTGRCGFETSIAMDYDQGLRVMKFKGQTGIGTHMDAPSHFFPKGKSIDEIGLENFLIPLYVLDIREKMSPDLMISKEDILTFEERHGRVQKNSLFIGFTGWSQFWNNPIKYRNELQFPGFQIEAAELLYERGVCGLGIDTLSPDGTNMTFPVHKKFLGGNRYLIENLSSLEKLPPIGALGIVLPMKIKGGSEAPIRAIAHIP